MLTKIPHKKKADKKIVVITIILNEKVSECNYFEIIKIYFFFSSYTDFVNLLSRLQVGRGIYKIWNSSKSKTREMSEEEKRDMSLRRKTF